MVRSMVQRNGVSALSDACVADQLALTELQRQEIERIQAENRRAMQQEVQRQAKAKKGNVHAILLQFHAAAKERILSVLNDQQRDAFEKLRTPDPYTGGTPIAC